MGGEPDHVHELVAVDGHRVDLLGEAIVLAQGLQVARQEEQQSHPSTDPVVEARQASSIRRCQGLVSERKGGRVVEPIGVPENETSHAVETPEERHLLELVVPRYHPD